MLHSPVDPPTYSPIRPLPLLPQVVLLLDADFLPARELTDLIHDPLMHEQLRRVTGYRQVRSCWAAVGRGWGTEYHLVLAVGHLRIICATN